MRLAAISDVHLGRRQFTARHAGRNCREVDIERAWHRCIDGIVRSKPDLVLVGGDVFEHPRVNNHATAAYLAGMAQLLAETEAHIIVAVGNHDAAKTADVLTPLRLAEDLDGFGNATSRVKIAVLPGTMTAGGAQVTVLPYSVGGQVACRLPEYDLDRLNVLLIHGPLNHPALPPFYGQESPSVENLAQFFDVIVAGDYHIFTELENNLNCLAFYCGATERTSTVWLEDGPFGWVMCDTQSKTVRHVPVRARRMRDLVFEVDSPEETNVLLLGLLTKYQDETPERLGDDLVRVTIKGLEREDRSQVDWPTVRKLKVWCRHFQLRFQDQERESITLMDRRVERKPLRDLAEKYLAGEKLEVRRKALVHINPGWREYEDREE